MKKLLLFALVVVNGHSALHAMLGTACKIAVKKSVIVDPSKPNDTLQATTIQIQDSPTTKRNLMIAADTALTALTDYEKTLFLKNGKDITKLSYNDLIEGRKQFAASHDTAYEALARTAIDALQAEQKSAIKELDPNAIQKRYDAVFKDLSTKITALEAKVANKTITKEELDAELKLLTDQIQENLRATRQKEIDSLYSHIYLFENPYSALDTLFAKLDKQYSNFNPSFNPDAKLRIGDWKLADWSVIDKPYQAWGERNTEDVKSAYSRLEKYKPTIDTELALIEGVYDRAYDGLNIQNQLSDILNRLNTLKRQKHYS